MEKYVRICPKCTSTNVNWRGAISRQAYSDAYICQSCGFHGIMFPEISPKKLMELRQETPEPASVIGLNVSRMPVLEDAVSWPLWKKILAIFIVVCSIISILSVIYLMIIA